MKLYLGQLLFGLLLRSVISLGSGRNDLSTETLQSPEVDDAIRQAHRTYDEAQMERMKAGAQSDYRAFKRTI